MKYHTNKTMIQIHNNNNIYMMMIMMMMTCIRITISVRPARVSMTLTRDYRSVRLCSLRYVTVYSVSL